jgi:hypothetical protein
MKPRISKLIVLTTIVAALVAAQPASAQPSINGLGPGIALASDRSLLDTTGTDCALRQWGRIGSDAGDGTSSRFRKDEPRGSKFFCDDFSSGTAERWEPQGGAWTVAGGQYVGDGLFDRPCPGFSNNETLIHDLKARNVDIQLDMQSIQRVDKGIILRSTGPGNQIELNFRAERPGEFPADLIVQEVVNCQPILYTPEFSVLIPPHQV